MGTLLLAAMLATYTGDVVTTCRNLGHGEHEHYSPAPSGCGPIVGVSGAGILGTVALLEGGHAPRWAKITVYGGLAMAHGWALQHNLRRRIQ